jgi:hypothetical protein
VMARELLAVVVLAMRAALVLAQGGDHFDYPDSQ